MGEETPHAVWSRFTLRLTLPVDQVPNPPCCSFFFLYINVSISFIYIWLRWVFVAARGLSLVAVSGGYSFLAVHRLLIAVASLVAEHGL